MENDLEKIGAFGQDAAIDTAADGAINSVIDGVAGHVPGGGAFDAMLKTGVDLAANNEINSQVGNIEGRFFGHHDSAPPAGDTDAAPPDDQQGDS
jgi:hypothetical protein